MQEAAEKASLETKKEFESQNKNIEELKIRLESDKQTASDANMQL